MQCTHWSPTLRRIQSNTMIWDSSQCHYNDVIMGAISSQITSFTILYPTVYSGADQRKHQSCASLSFVRGIHRGLVNSPHKWPVTRKMFQFDDLIMIETAFTGFWIPIMTARRSWPSHRYTEDAYTGKTHLYKKGPPMWTSGVPFSIKVSYHAVLPTKTYMFLFCTNEL